MIKWLVEKLLGAVLSPLTRLGEKYLDNQRDKQVLDAGITHAAYKADAAVRSIKFGSILGRLPLFVAEFACAAYIAAVLADSIYPTDYLNPLELPEWFKPHFTTILASVAGLAVTERVFDKFRRR